MRRVDFEVIPQESGEHKALVLKCQENGWIKDRGLIFEFELCEEGIPFEFAKSDDFETLRSFFICGEWNARQGIVYRDLAFIQLDPRGDEWWTLKRSGNGKWVAFDTWSFDTVKWVPARFSGIIASMEMATIDQCKQLAYGLPDNDLMWTSGIEVSLSPNEGKETRRWFRGESAEYEVRVYERVGYDGYSARITAKQDRCVLYSENHFRDAIRAASAACERVANYSKNDVAKLSRAKTRSLFAERVLAKQEGEGTALVESTDEGGYE